MNEKLQFAGVLLSITLELIQASAWTKKAKAKAHEAGS